MKTVRYEIRRNGISGWRSIETHKSKAEALRSLKEWMEIGGQNKIVKVEWRETDVTEPPRPSPKRRNRTR